MIFNIRSLSILFLVFFFFYDDIKFLLHQIEQSLQIKFFSLVISKL